MIYLARWFKKLFYGTLLIGSLYSQDFFKFSTIYGAYSLSSPITKQQQFQVSGGQLQELQEELDDHSIMTFGIRKLARFGYENKPGKFYTGAEAPINESVAIGNIITGWEYVVEYSDHTEFEEDFINQCGSASVLLDPLYFGSGNSFYESMFYGTPTVTMPNNSLKSNVVYGAYKQMKIENPPIVKNIEEYVDKAIFDEYKEYGLSIGFKVVESGPLVRSSYHADEQARMVL